MKQFRVGERVFACGLTKRDKKYGTHQKYVAVRLPFVQKIPGNLSYEQAAVLPLCLSTAASAVFDALGLTLPPSSQGSGKTVLIWGGSSVVGSCAIQLAVNSGYDVIATSSTRNFQHCLDLGASHVIDYTAPDVEEQILNSLKGKDVFGAVEAVWKDTNMAVLCNVLEKCGGRKVLASVMPIPEYKKDDITVRPAMSTVDSKNTNYIWQEYIYNALNDGKFKVSPAPTIIGQGLDSIQTGLDKLAAGVSAQKIVVNEIDK